MRRVIILFFLTVIFSAGNLSAQLLRQKIKLEDAEASVGEWFERIERLGINLAYNPAEIDFEKTIKPKKSEMTLEELLFTLLGRERYRFLPKENKILIVKKTLSFTLSGFIREALSNETLIGAVIKVQGSDRGVVSNSYGFYSLTLPEGNYEIKVSYIGYESRLIRLELNKNIQQNVDLKTNFTHLRDVQVTALPKDELRINSLNRIDLQDNDRQVNILGIEDALKEIQMFAGVQGGASGLNQLNVRGGSADNNLVLLDGVPLYNYNHFTGLMSIFNNDALKHVDFYKGAFPARYNGRLSSVIDVRMREGDMQHFHAGASVNMLATSAFAEGPLLKDKASFMLSARRSWIDLVSKIFNTDVKPDFSLYDINLKMNYNVNTRNHLFLSFYSGEDAFGSLFTMEKNKKTLSWGNRLVSLRWNRVISDKLFTNTTFSVSTFSNSMRNDSKPSESRIRQIDYKLTEATYNSDFQYFGEYMTIRVGNRLTYNYFKPTLQSDARLSENSRLEIQTLHDMLYFENKIQLQKNINLNLGLNYNYYQAEKKDRYHRFQSRAVIDYSPSFNHTIYVGFSEMSQFFHQLSSTGISLPYEFRMPSSRQFAPSQSRLFELGWNARFDRERQQISITAFSNRQHDIVRYRPSQNVWDVLLAEDTEKQIVRGKRQGKGLETSYSLKRRSIELTTAYTLSDVREVFAEINKGLPFVPSMHSRHNFKSSLHWQLRPQHSLTAVFSANSGYYISIHSYTIPDMDEVLGIKRPDIDAVNTLVGTAYNNYKLRDNYQLDLGYTFHKVSEKKYRHTLKAGLYNLFGRSAPFLVKTEKNHDTGKWTIKETAMPHFMPYLSYGFRF